MSGWKEVQYMMITQMKTNYRVALSVDVSFLCNYRVFVIKLTLRSQWLNALHI